MPRPAINEMGHQYGKLTVLERAGSNRQGKALWKCQCECGNITIVDGRELRRGNTQSCGCGIYNPRVTTEHIGERFGSLVIIERIYDKKIIGNDTAHSYWKCQCDCGNTRIISYNLLARGNCISCGCMPSLHVNNLIGQKLNNLTVLKYIGTNENHQAIWECKCDCGNIINYTSIQLLHKHKLSCGCITMSRGELYISTILDKNNIIYQREKTFPTCRFPLTNSLARFDFYINNQFLLEFDGEQHYNSNNIWYKTEQEYQAALQRDIYKNNWCKENNIPLKRIAYTDIDKITIDNIMDDTFLLR